MPINLNQRLVDKFKCGPQLTITSVLVAVFIIFLGVAVFLYISIIKFGASNIANWYKVIIRV